MVLMPMKRILMVQPSLQPPGGGNGVAVWMIEGLKREYEISVLAWTPVDLPPINRYYGTALSPSDFMAHLPPAWLRRALDAGPASLSLLKTSLLLRWCKKVKQQYDLIITANNEADFGCRGIQYVHFPWTYQPRPQVDLRWYHGASILVDAYYRLCIWLGQLSIERMKQNLTLVNSDWIGGKVRELYGIESVTLYPPALGEFPEVPWEERKNAFVCIGRIAPEKELEKIIGILTRVKQQGYEVQLRIIGSPDNVPYTARIRQLIAANPEWTSLYENLPRDQLVRLVSTCRYGIHGMPEEHFGMAVAEMVRGGCIVFVPRSGGQVEILGDQDLLFYDTVDEAAAKISQVLANADLQLRLRSYLATRKALFSTESFVRQMRNIVHNFDKT
jgi:glycosyltransferase involved in cell wall biosynthesis